MSHLLPIAQKIMTPAEAVRRFVKDGDLISLGGFTVNRNPMALAREIARQGIKGLHLACHSQGQAMDLLVGAGCIDRMELAYAGAGRFAPTCVRFRKAVQEGRLLAEDYSNYQMGLRFLAGALGLPFLPCRSGFGSDILNQDRFGEELRGSGGRIPSRKLIVTENPFGKEREPVVLLPALNPDVTLLHVQYVGDDGTVRIKGLPFLDLEQAKSARRVVLSCEEIVPAALLRQDPDQNTLPPFLVDAVVPVPFGAHPTACNYFYDYDPEHLHRYREEAEDEARFAAYLREWVYGLPDEAAYREKVGANQLQLIRANSQVGYAVGLDRR